MQPVEERLWVFLCVFASLREKGKMRPHAESERGKTSFTQRRKDAEERPETTD
jgi:hypothetical protein